jgi:(Z)-2-((N-methylformamido)methylene)-5-hydroxybutyrolactone dehydrogenase
MRFADVVAELARRLASLETRQNGRVLREMSAQLESVPEWFYYFGGVADKIEGSVVPLDNTRVVNPTLHEPAGAVGAIIPWNSPALIAPMRLAPAVAPGCTAVIKPSEHASAGAIELAASSPTKRARSRRHQHCHVR